MICSYFLNTYIKLNSNLSYYIYNQNIKQSMDLHKSISSFVKMLL